MKKYESLNSKNNVKSKLVIKNIRLRHPLFAKFSPKVFSFLIDNSLIYKLKSGQFIYREAINCAPNIYIIMYG